MDVLGQQEPGKGRDHNVVACRPRERAGVVSLPEGRLMGWRVQGGWEGLKMLRMFARQVMPVIEEGKAGHADGAPQEQAPPQTIHPFIQNLFM